MTRRALVVCPGRGSYGATELRSLRRLSRLPRAEAARDGLLPIADAFLLDHGRPTVSELDAAPAFEPRLHLSSVNASVLTYVISAIHHAALESAGFRPVAIAGNSLGWYTALATGGAISFRSGLELVLTMGEIQGGERIGGQLVYPLVGADWRPRPERRDALDQAVTAANRAGGFAAWSVDLAGYGVLAGDELGMDLLLAGLPEVVSGGRTYPLVLPGHSAFHTPLLARRARIARQRLDHLEFGRPAVPLIDGRGRQHRPLSADPAEISGYTLGDQVTTAYDLAASVRVGLREYAPDSIVLLGPGESIGGALGACLVREGWRGVRNREDFDAAQASSEPPLVSLARLRTSPAG